MGYSPACSNHAQRLAVFVHFLLLSFVSLSNLVSCSWIDRQNSLNSKHAPGQRHSLPHHVKLHNSNTVSAKTQTRLNEHVYGLNNFITRHHRIVTKRGVLQTNSNLIDNTSDREVLLEFKGAVKPFWGLEVLRSWNPSTNPNVCSGWEGVGCNRAQRVVTLRLSNMGLMGSISPALGNLSFLTTLDLTYNSFSGSLPREFGTLANLEELIVAFNMLNGTLIDLPNSRNLRSLDLSYNQFIGGIPPEWNNSTNLQSLNLTGNFLTGGIPREFGALGSLEELILGLNFFNMATFTATSNWTRLRSLDFTKSQVTGIVWQVGDWSSLETLFLSENLLTEVNIFANFTNLRALDLSVNQLSGPKSILSKVGDLTNLQFLDFSGNQLSGTIPSSLGNCTKLQSFHLSSNDMSGPIPSCLAALQELSSLDLSSNFLTGSIPPELGVLSSLNYLNIAYNPLGGNLPSAIANCSNLQTLILSNTSLTGKLSFKFDELLLLEDLDLSSNSLSGNISVVSNCTGLKVLNLQSNNFNGPLPTFLDCANLSYLDMSSNNLDGGISMLSNCTNLDTLNLSSNYFIGGIVETLLVSLTNLVILDLSGNQLSGALPNLDGALKTPWYFKLSLASNRLEGEIPLWIWGQTSLFQLDLSDNFFVGNISHIEIISTNLIHADLTIHVNANSVIVFEDTPGGMNSLKYKLSGDFAAGLYFIDLSSNLLSGEIPPSFGNLQGLHILNLDNNFFFGNIPKNIANCSSLKFLSAANNILTGNIQIWPLGLILMDLSSNQLHGPIPLDLSNFTQLLILRLKKNSLSGSIDFKFDRMQSLVAVVLAKNHLYGSFPKSLMNCSKLQLLDLNSNHIGVGIGVKIPNISNYFGELRVLDVGLNDMEGEVPTWIWKLPKLQVLDLSYNQFHGTIPNDFIVLGGMRNATSSESTSWTLQERVDITWNGVPLTFEYVRHDLTSLDLSSNNFSGTIPSQFGDLKDLINLNLSNNIFNGTLRQKFDSMKSLESIDLSFNHLLGSIPSSLAKLYYLKTLKLGGNNFSGLLPSGKQFDTFKISSYRPGNIGLCGYPLKSCDNTSIQFFNSTTSRCKHDSKMHQCGASFYDIFSIISLEIGIVLGFSLVISVLVISRHIRHRFFGLINLSDYRQFTRSYGLFREKNS